MVGLPELPLPTWLAGSGNMGGAIATRIIQAGWPTILWARRPSALPEPPPASEPEPPATKPARRSPGEVGP